MDIYTAMDKIGDANLDALTALKNRFAGLTSDVSLSTFDWRVLMESGALASLHVARYRGTMALTAADLGIDQVDMDLVAGIVDLGQRLLLPKEILGQFNSVETRARQVLRQYCLKTPAGLFLPASAYASAAASMTEYQTKFNILVNDLTYQINDHRTAMTEQYYTLSKQVYDRLTLAAPMPVDKWTFEDAFVERCMRAFPTADQLRGAFEFGLRLEFVPLPYQTAQGETPRFAEATNEIVQMRRDVIEDQNRARDEIVNGFVASVQGELYTLVNVALSDVLGSIKNNNALQSRSVVQLKSLCEKLGQLNFWRDKRLEIMQQEIMDLLDRTGSKRDLAMDVATLDALQQESRFILAKLGSGTARTLDIAPETTPAIVLPETRQQESIVISADGVGTGVLADNDTIVIAQAQTLDARDYLTSDSVDRNGNIVYRRPVAPVKVDAGRGKRLF